MSMRDRISDVKMVLALAGALRSADITSASLNRTGYNSLSLALEIGPGGITFDATNKIEFVWTHSDDDSVYTNVTTADLIGTTVTDGIIRSLTAAHAAAAVYKFGYRGGKKYHRIFANFSGTHGTGTEISAVWILGDPAVGPAALMG